jgi:hypothetical protein
MNRLCASLSLGLAMVASVGFGAQTGPTLGAPSLGGPTLLSQPYAPDLPMPAPLNGSPTPLSNEVQYNGPVGQLPVVTMTNPVLFSCVKYRATRNIAPCAVPIIVQVPDPCAPRDRCGCTVRPCVNVEICVPACGCPNVCVTRNGNKTRYDYGKYAVNVVTHNGRIVVDYDD